jgi:hypothetical protein
VDVARVEREDADERLEPVVVGQVADGWGEVDMWAPVLATIWR